MKQRSRPSFSNLRPGQRATLFPSLGYRDEKRECWRALVHGRVYNDSQVPIATRLLLRGLKKAMRATPEEIASDTFKKRIDGFLAAPGRHRRIVLEVAKQQYRLRRRTRRNGTFYGTLKLPAAVSQASAFSAASGIGMLRIQLLQSSDADGMIAGAEGLIHMVPSTGISVVSDIDDTIKLTETTSKRELLANTFLRPFEAVDGMSQIYRHWQEQGCAFHYVSSSPWQLYDHLAELCTASNFPSGSMHLRYFRVRDEMFKRFRPVRRNAKVGIISGIIKRLPQRRFMLIGDSGEKDPEVYRFIANRFPYRVAAILIRNLSSRPMDLKRIRKLNSVAGTTRICIFEESAQLAVDLGQMLAR